MTTSATRDIGDGIGNGIRTVVLVSGGGTNLQAIINEIRSGEMAINLCAVISDRPGILGLDRADKASIPTRIVDYQHFAARTDADAAMAAELAAIAPDLVVLAGFMRILPDAIVRQYHGRMLNIHPSLLPKYRGAALIPPPRAAGGKNRQRNQQDVLVNRSRKRHVNKIYTQTLDQAAQTNQRHCCFLPPRRNTAHRVQHAQLTEQKSQPNECREQRGSNR